MAWTLECILTVLSALGLAALGGWLLGRLLCPIPAKGVRTLVQGVGDGETLEQTVRGLIWLRSLGLFSCSIEIVDGGLSAQGREIAERLSRRWPEISIQNPP